MAVIRNDYIVDKAVEITIAKLSSDEHSANDVNGKTTAAYIQHVYDKLVELYGNVDTKFSTN